MAQISEENKIKYTRNNKSRTLLEFEITIPKKDFKKKYDEELKRLSKKVELKGFRKGKAPVDMVEKTTGTEAIKSALEFLMPRYAVEVVKQENIMPVANLEYEAASANPDSDIIFKVFVPVIPEFKMTDLKKIKAKKEGVMVTDKEVDEQLKHFWVTYKGESKNMDDAWVKSFAGKIGLKAKTLDELKKELKDEIRKAKEGIAQKKYAADLLTEAIHKSEIEVPDALIMQEAGEREHSFMHSLEDMKVTLKEFLNIRNITIEQLREQWWKDSLEALENDVFLNAYAKERSIKVSEAELNEEIKRIKEANKNAEASLFDNPEWRRYIEHVMLKRRAYEMFLKEVGFEQDSGEKNEKPRVKSNTK